MYGNIRALDTVNVPSIAVEQVTVYLLRPPK